jgi:2-polyprenyl-3-methyl-5-hydroxy-6-metoxy-1,4-benzoquinol methylase
MCIDKSANTFESRSLKQMEVSKMQKEQISSAEIRDIWNTNAYFWDERMGEGNDFQNLLLEPAQKRLLALQPGELVLDVACGNGVFSRKMARMGCRVVGADVSEKLIEIAKEKSKAFAEQITYEVIDATEPNQLLSLGKGQYDAVLCAMALMDMQAIKPLIEAATELLKKTGRFVFSICHPCFNSGDFRLAVEEEEKDGRVVETCSVKILNYIEETIKLGVAMRNQPASQYYFHRPLSHILTQFFDAGFVLDGLEEPAFGELSNKKGISDRVFRKIPPALVARMRLAAR